MESISFADVLTIIYFLVDEWLQRHAPEVRGRVGRPKEMSESELLTLMLASEMLGFDGERRRCGGHGTPRLWLPVSVPLPYDEICSGN